MIRRFISMNFFLLLLLIIVLSIASAENSKKSNSNEKPNSIDESANNAEAELDSAASYPAVDLASLAGSQSNSYASLGETSRTRLILPAADRTSADSSTLTADDSRELSLLLQRAASYRFAVPDSTSFNHSDSSSQKSAFQHQLKNFDSVELDVAIDLYKQAVQLFSSSEALTALGEIYFYGEGSIPVNYSRASSYFKSAADRGNSFAQHYLAILYATGLSGEISPALAIIYDHFAALAGNPMAKLSLGWRHLYGVHAAQSCELSINYYSEVAKLVVEDLMENPISLLIEKNRLSDETLRDKSNDEDSDVVQYYDHRAGQGDAAASVALGQLYFYGARGFIQNPAIARKYFESAAEQNDPTAFYYLGTIFYHGLGIPKPDYQLAFENYQTAIQLGSMRANNGLGLIYLYGRGRTADPGQALRHFKTSAEAGDSTGQFYLGQMYYNGAGGIEVKYSTAINYYSLAAVAGHTRAIYFLALMHLQGHGTPPSCQQAVKLMKTVAERGVWALNMNLAHRLYRVDRAESSLSYYSRLALEGHEVAQSNAGWLASQNRLSAEIPIKQIIDNTNQNENTEKSSTISTEEVIDNSISSTNAGTDKFELSIRNLRNYLTHQFYSYSSLQNSIDSLRLLGDYYYYTENHYPQAISHYQKASELRNGQSLFNLAWMFQHGIGVDRDFHLAKRNFDLAIEVDPNAWIPVKLAMLVMNSQAVLEESEYGKMIIAWAASFAAAALEFCRPNHSNNKNSVLLSQSIIVNRIINNFNSLLESSGEDLLLILLVISLGFLVIFKRRR